MAIDNFFNFAKCTVSIGYNSTATSVVLSSGNGAKLPAVPFNVVWYNSTDYADPSDDPNVEVVRVTNVSTDTLTITRAQESTTASTKNTSAKTYLMLATLTAKTTTDIQAALIRQTGSNSVSFSSTPAFDCSLASVQKITLTGNVSSSTVSNLLTGPLVTFVITQDATGGRTFVWPTNVFGGITVDPTASAVSVQTFVSPDGSNLYAIAVGITN